MEQGKGSGAGTVRKRPGLYQRDMDVPGVCPSALKAEPGFGWAGQRTGREHRAWCFARPRRDEDTGGFS